MRFRRRRKPRVKWLPNTGTAISQALTAFDQSSSIIFNENPTFTTASPTTVIETPMVLDNSPETAIAGSALAALQLEALDDQNTFGYRLRRIYGEMYVFASSESATPGDAPAAILVSAGIIVRRIDPATGQALATGVSDTDPDAIGNNEDPWLFRKTWVLTPILNILTAGTSTLLPAPDASDDWGTNANSLPRTNLFHTGPHSTPTVDVRAARRVSEEERLFFDIAFTRMPSAVPPQQSQRCNIKVCFSYRVLATMTLVGGNRRNASR